MTSTIKAGVWGIIQTEKQNDRDIICKLDRLVLKYYSNLTDVPTHLTRYQLDVCPNGLPNL